MHDHHQLTVMNFGYGYFTINCLALPRIYSEAYKEQSRMRPSHHEWQVDT